jgi:hypothetical protein
MCFPQLKAMFPLSNDEEIFEAMDEEDMVIFYCMVIACNLHNSFTSHEIAKRIRQSHLWTQELMFKKFWP